MRGIRPGNVLHRAYPLNFAGFAKVTLDNSSFTFRAAHFVRETPRGASGTLIHRDEEPFIAAFTEDDAFLNYHYNWDISETSSLDINPSVHYFRYREQSFLTDTAAEVPPLGTRSGVLTEHTVSQLKLTYRNQFLESLHLTGGMDLIYADWLRRDGLEIDTLTDAADNIVIVDGKPVQYMKITPNGAHAANSTFQVGFLAQAEWQLRDDLALTVGGRLDYFRSISEVSFVPRVGLVYTPSEQWTLKALYGQSVLAPSVFQATSADPNFLGNANLSPEKFAGTNLTALYTRGSFSAEVDLFYNNAEDFINSTTLGGGTKQYQNGGVAEYIGGHTIFRYNWNRYLAGHISYSYLTDLSGTSANFLVNGMIKSVPAHTIRYGVTSHPIDHLSLSLVGRTVGSSNVNDSLTGRTTLPSATVFDLAANYDYKNWQFQLVVLNVFDESYSVGDAGGARPLPRAGATVELGVTIKF